MANYKIVNTGNNFEIFENQTGQTLASFKKLCDAKKALNFYNTGGGFNGWTPNFFLQKNVKT